MMKSNNNWLIFLTISILLLLAVVGASVGVYYYWQLNNEKQQIIEAKKQLEERLAVLQNNLATTTEALQSERLKTSSVVEQLNGLATTVGTLDKLSKTDRELLKKYSKVYFLNENYIPSNLATITPEYLSYPKQVLKIHANIWPKLESLISAASSSGVNLQINSAYRSFGTQAAIKSSYKVTYGAGSANAFSADQGYSEHQLGTTVDFGTPSIKGDFSKFGKSEASSWLVANAYKYGFTLSYPQGNAYYQYEPWHWRYVGVALATRLQNDHLHFYDLAQRLIDTYLVNIFD